MSVPVLLLSAAALGVVAGFTLRLLVFAAAAVRRRRDDVRSAREFEAFRASLRHPASLAAVEAQVASGMVDRRRS